MTITRETKRRVMLATAAAAFVILLTAALMPSAQAEGAMSQLELAQTQRANCQVLLARATTSAQRSRANQCIADQTVIINALTSPSPSTSPSTSPSPSPSLSASASPSPTPGACPVAGTNVPGGADPWGGCWPGPGNTGVPAGTVLTAYTGPCTITTANFVIDSKTVTCPTLDIRATGVIIRNSRLIGVDVNDDIAGTGSFTIVDSTVSNGPRDQCQCVGTNDFTALRVEVVGGNRSMYCQIRCSISDSWLHGQQLQGAQHGSGLREEQFTTARHNTIVCDYPYTDDATSLGCSAGLTGYPDFAPIHDNAIDHNLFLASITVSFCAYGGATAGKPYSGSSLNATNQVFTNNVFQRGGNQKCGFYGPITDFATNRIGNVWSGNTWSTGETVPAG